MLECAQVVLQVTGSKSTVMFEPLPLDDPKQRRPDITKARDAAGLGAEDRFAEPGWSCRWSIFGRRWSREILIPRFRPPRRTKGCRTRLVLNFPGGLPYNSAGSDSARKMDTHSEFDDLRRDSESWWYTTRRVLLREAALQALHGKREARVLDLGCTAQLEFDEAGLYRVCNLHSSLKTLAFRQIEGDANLVCSRIEELGVASNSFDAIVAGDVLQSCADDLAALREMRRVLKEGGLLCLTVPAYSFLWGEDDEARGHQRRYTHQRTAAQADDVRISHSSRVIFREQRFFADGRRAIGEEYLSQVDYQPSALSAPFTAGKCRNDGAAGGRAAPDALHQPAVWDAGGVLGTEAGAGD